MVESDLNNGDQINHRQRLALLGATVGGHGIKHVFNAAFFVILPEIKGGLGLSNSRIGTLATGRNVAGGLANLPAGFVADRFSSNRSGILGVSMALIGVFALSLGLANTFVAAVLAASFMTAAISFWHPAAISGLSRHFSNRRGLAISVHGTGGSVGEALGPVLAGFLLTMFSWRSILRASVIPAMAGGGLVWILLRIVPSSENSLSDFRQYVHSFVQLLRNRRLLLVLLFAGGFASSQSAVLTFLPIYLREDVGVSSIALGLYLSLAQLAGIGSQPIMGYLSDRFGRKTVMVPGMLGLGISFVGLYLVPVGWGFGLIVLLMGVFLFPMMAIFLAAAMDLVEQEVQATTVSLVFGTAIILSGLSPAVAGVFADRWGVESAFLWGAGTAIITGILALVTPWQGNWNSSKMS